MKVEKPGHAVKCGDVLTLRAGPAVVAVRVVAVAERRGPANEARALYQITE